MLYIQTAQNIMLYIQMAQNIMLYIQTTQNIMLYIQTAQNIMLYIHLASRYNAIHTYSLKTHHNPPLQALTCPAPFHHLLATGQDHRQSPPPPPPSKGLLLLLPPLLQIPLPNRCPQRRLARQPPPRRAPPALVKLAHLEEGWH